LGRQIMVVIQYLPKSKSLPILEQCMQTVKDACKRQNIPYKLYTEPPYIVDDHPDDYRYASDLIRLNLACYIPDMLYIDADTYCYSIPDQYTFENGYPYFQDNKPIADIAYYYVNNCCGYYRHLRDIHAGDTGLHYTGWLQNKINADRANIRLLPRGHFQHLSISRMLLDNNLDRYGFSGHFEVVRDDKGELKLNMMEV
jgi:hypothetical protein